MTRQSDIMGDFEATLWFTHTYSLLLIIPLMYSFKWSWKISFYFIVNKFQSTTSFLALLFNFSLVFKYSFMSWLRNYHFPNIFSFLSYTLRCKFLRCIFVEFLSWNSNCNCLYFYIIQSEMLCTIYIHNVKNFVVNNVCTYVVILICFPPRMFKSTYCCDKCNMFLPPVCFCFLDILLTCKKMVVFLKTRKKIENLVVWFVVFFVLFVRL